MTEEKAKDMDKLLHIMKYLTITDRYIVTHDELMYFLDGLKDKYKVRG